MIRSAPASQTTAVLIGAGHAHLHLIRSASQFLARGIQPVLIEPGDFWYSGLATGMLGGSYPCELDRVDPARLLRRCGGRLIRDRAVGLDPDARHVHLASGGVVRYDAASWNIGSEVSFPADWLSPRGETGVWPVKPIHNLCRLRRRLESAFAAPPRRPLRVLVIGGGPAGCEAAAGIHELARRRRAAARITLLTRSPRLLVHQPPTAARAADRALGSRGIARRTSCSIARVKQEGGVGVAVARDGQRFSWDHLVVATGLRPPRLLGSLPLAAGPGGGLRVRSTLQSPDDPRIFGAGDCIEIIGHRLPRLGVFAVRQAPILRHNLIARLTGEPLKRYRPQKRWLTILHLGERDALASWGPLCWRGRLSFHLKDYLDRRFLNQYQQDSE